MESEVKGFPATQLLFQAAGRYGKLRPDCAGRLVGGAAWTPYLPVRHWHQRRETVSAYLTKDLHTELGYRDLPLAGRRVPPTV